MKLLCLLLLLPVLSFAADGKDSLQASALYKKATEAKLGGDPTLAKKLFLELIRKYPKTKFTAEDAEIHDDSELSTYADSAKDKLVFVNAELKEGKKRAFPDESKLMDALLTALKSGDKKKIAALAWVEVYTGPCESDAGGWMSPDQAAAEVLSHASGLLPKLELLQKDLEPKNRFIIKAGKFLEFRFLKKKAGWTWSTFLYCTVKEGFY